MVIIALTFGYVPPSHTSQIIGKVILSASVTNDIMVAATLSYYLHISRTGVTRSELLEFRNCSDGVLILALRPQDR